MVFFCKQPLWISVVDTEAYLSTQKFLIQLNHTFLSWMTNICITVLPLVSWRFGLAPLASSRRTHSSWPKQAAKLKGYSPKYTWLMWLKENEKKRILNDSITKSILVNLFFLSTKAWLNVHCSSTLISIQFYKH